MKKVFLTVALFAGFGLAASAQCGTDATQVYASCWSGCVTMLTPNGFKKPTLMEFWDAVNDLEAKCTARAMVATTIDPNA